MASYSHIKGGLSILKGGLYYGKKGSEVLMLGPGSATDLAATNMYFTLGTFSSTAAGSGVELENATYTAAHRVYADDGGDDLMKTSGSIPDIRGSLTRVLVTHDQTSGDMRLFGTMGQIKSVNVAWDDEQISSVHGYLELTRTAGTVTFGGYGVSSGVMATVETSGTMTVNTNHILAGVASISKMSATGLTQTGKTAAFYSGVYDATNWSDGSDARTKWAYGLYLAGCVRGISFDGVVPPTAAGNYGQTLDCGWLAIDPGSGGTFGAKLMFSNIDTSGYVLYGLGLRCRSYAASAKAVAFNCSASASVASSGQVMGGEFYLQNSGSYTINDPGGLPSTALHVKSWLAAACSQTASALWIDDQSTTKATTQYMVDITMNGDVEIDKVFHIYGGDPGADTFIDFDTCDQGAGAFVVATGSGGATRSHRIKCTVNGSTVGYLSLYTD